MIFFRKIKASNLTVDSNVGVKILNFRFFPSLNVYFEAKKNIYSKINHLLYIKIKSNSIFLTCKFTI